MAKPLQSVDCIFPNIIPLFFLSPHLPFRDCLLTNLIIPEKNRAKVRKFTIIQLS
ncbi:hypothetical protein ABKV19_020699 [Rosa sericea]